MDKEDILVSVVVITYNSCETVVETLDSIFNQTYPNIELIISDDCSKDDTIQVCKKWLSEHSHRFINSFLLESPINTGTSANLNRALKKVSGIWIKEIASDDRLISDCISKFICHIKKNPQQKIIFSKVKGIGNMEAAERWPLKNVKWLFDNLSLKEMRILLTRRNFLPAASAFIKKDVFKQIGLYDESIPLIEDWPFWIKALFNNIPLSFYNEFVSEYRFSDKSVSQKREKGLNSIYLESLAKASEYAQQYNNHISFLMKYYFWSSCQREQGKFYGKILYCLNIFNPDYYLLKRTMKKFEYFLAHHKQFN